MEEFEEPDEDDLECQPFDWERLLRWLLVAGLILWVLGGAASTIIAYFEIGGGFLTAGSEGCCHVAAAAYKISVVVESIAFRTWIAAASLLIFLWYRTRMRDTQP
jgi:hypothetical protein